MAKRNIKMEQVEVGDAINYFDINDVYDIIERPEEKYNVIVFKDGEQWVCSKISKSIINKFKKIREKERKL